MDDVIYVNDRCDVGDYFLLSQILTNVDELTSKAIVGEFAEIIANPEKYREKKTEERKREEMEAEIEKEREKAEKKAEIARYIEEKEKAEAEEMKGVKDRKTGGGRKRADEEAQEKEVGNKINNLMWNHGSDDGNEFYGGNGKKVLV